MIILGIDPDTKATGCALLDDQRIADVRCIRVPGARAEDRIATMAWILRNWVAEQAPDVLVVEAPWIPPSLRFGRRQVRPNDIVNLAMVAGAALAGGRADVKVLTPRPHEWRGTAPKDVVQRRILQEVGLTLASPEFEGIIPSMRTHAVDALGLALWAREHGDDWLRRRAARRAR